MQPRPERISRSIQLTMGASRYAITRPTSTGDRMDASFDTIRCSVPFI